MSLNTPGRVPRRLARGTNAEVGAYTGPQGELVVNTDTSRVHVQDGATVGGIPLRRLDEGTVANKEVTNAKLADMTAKRIKGAVSAGTPQDLTPTEVRTIIGAELYNVVVEGGCDNTGATNTRVAINAAITAATSAKRPIYFPQGDYTLTGGPIQVPSDTHIVCHPRAKFIRTDNTTAATVEIVGKSNVLIENMWVHYTPAAGTLGYAQVGFQIRNGSINVTLHNCRSTGRINRGFHVLNSRDVNIKDCYVLGASNAALRVVSDFASSSATALGETTPVNCENVVIEGCTFDGAEIDGTTTQYTSYGVNFAGETGASDQIRDCRILNCTVRNFALQAIEVGGKCHRVRVKGCNAVRCGSAGGGFGFLFQLYGGNGVFYCSMEDCTAYQCGYGFNVYSAQYSTLKNCQAISCFNDGFFFQDATICRAEGCDAVSNGGDGYDIRNADNSAFVNCVASLNTGWGFTEDAATNAARIALAQCISNTAGQYNRLGTNPKTTENI